MKKITFALLGLLIAGNTYAQQIRVKENRLMPVFITVGDDEKLPSKQFLDNLKTTYKLGSLMSFVIVNSSRDNLGMVHERYAQYYNGHQVEGSALILHLKNGKVQSCNGDVFPVKPGTTPAISERAAFNKAKEYFKADTYAWETEGFKKHKEPKGELMYIAETGNPKKDPFILAYRFDMYAVAPLKKAFVYIDIKDGHVIRERNTLADVSVTGTATTKYSGVRPLITESPSPNYFILEDLTRGGGIGTYTMNYTTTSSPIDCESMTNIWIDTVGDHGSEHDVHWAMQRVYDYYDTVHQRLSYDNMVGPVIGIVHYGTNYSNAFWNGWAMVFGDGSAATNMRPLTSLEIVAHEFTHGVTEHSANLIYQNESGALNESFSDIFGKTIELRYKPATFSWQLGKEIYTNNSYMRSMSSPKLKLDPDCYEGTYWYTGTDDNGGVHTNSGVQNYWYYLLSIGKTGVNDKNNAYSVTGIGTDKASAIAYRNLTVYLTPYSEYAEARSGAIQAAIDLFGPCSDEVRQTTNAWYAVGVGGPSMNVLASATVVDTALQHAYVHLNGSSINATGNTWLRNNVYFSNNLVDSCVFTTPGLHNVLLVSSNGSCSDSSAHNVYIKSNVSVAGNTGNKVLHVYPNPVSNYFMIEGTTKHKTLSYQLTDLSGKTILQKTIVPGNGGQYKEQISVQNLANGIYNITVTDDDQPSSAQVIVSK